MTALGDVGTGTEIAPNAGVKMIQVTFPATVIGGTDTATVDLSEYGCTNIHGITVFDETTAGSVVVEAAPTTSVSSSTLTITFGGSATCKKTAIIYAY